MTNYLLSVRNKKTPQGNGILNTATLAKTSP